MLLNNKKDKDVYCVVSIPNVYSIVINAGEQLGIQVGDYFEVYGKSEEVIDPATKESLGTLDYVKAKVEVVTCYDKMCICENIVRTPGSMGLALLSITAMLGSSERKALNVDENDIGSHIDEYDAPIKIGDYARHIKKPIIQESNETPKLIEEGEGIDNDE